MNFIEESNRIYCKDSQGKVIAEVTFPDIRYHVVNLNHTFVDSSLRGQGIAGKMMEEAAQKIRRDGKKVIPTCPYAVKWFEKNTQYRDLLETKEQNDE